MMGHVRCVDEIRLVGEVGNDLREQVGWKMVKRGLKRIDATTQHCQCCVYIILYSLQLEIRVRTGRDAFENKGYDG